MIEALIQQYPKQVYRIDKFKVPKPARDEFIQKVRVTHGFIQTLPGFIQDLVLEQTGGSSEFNFVTVVVWESAEAIASAKQAVMAKHEEIGFKPHEMFNRLGIKADLANYSQIEDYKIRSARAEDLALLAPIERSAAALFENTPYSFLVSAEPLPLEFVQQRFQAGQVWVAVDRDDTVIGYAIANEVDDTPKNNGRLVAPSIYCGAENRGERF